jgi:hypothetical protein
MRYNSFFQWRRSFYLYIYSFVGCREWSERNDGLRDFMSQKVELFITTVTGTSDPTLRSNVFMVSHIQFDFWQQLFFPLLRRMVIGLNWTVCVDTDEGWWERVYFVWKNRDYLIISDELVNGREKMNSGTTLFNKLTSSSSTCCCVGIDALRDNWSFQKLFRSLVLFISEFVTA